MNFSTRYALHIAVLCGLALIPVLVHKYLDVRRDECADPFRLVPSTVTGAAKQERDQMMRSHFKAVAWREGRLPGSPRLDYAIVRSYDAKELYYRFERSLLRKAEPVSVDLEQLRDGDFTIPIRRLRFKTPPGSQQRVLAAYLLVYDGAPVKDPYRNQLLAAPKRLFLGRLPMTIFFVYGLAGPNNAQEVEDRLHSWLLRSWRDYREICFPESPPPA